MGKRTFLPRAFRVRALRPRTLAGVSAAPTPGPGPKRVFLPRAFLPRDFRPRALAGPGAPPPAVTRRFAMTWSADTALTLAWSADTALTMTWGADMARKTDFVFNRGEAVSWLATAAVPPAGGIAGWTLARYVRKKPYDPTAPDNGPVLLTLALSVVDPAACSYSGELTAAQNLTLGTGLVYYDDWRIDAGFETELAYGTWTINKAAKG